MAALLASNFLATILEYSFYCSYAIYTMVLITVYTILISQNIFLRTSLNHRLICEDVHSFIYIDLL